MPLRRSRSNALRASHSSNHAIKVIAAMEELGSELQANARSCPRLVQASSKSEWAIVCKVNELNQVPSALGIR